MELREQRTSDMSYLREQIEKVGDLSYEIESRLEDNPYQLEGMSEFNSYNDEDMDIDKLRKLIEKHEMEHLRIKLNRERFERNAGILETNEYFKLKKNLNELSERLFSPMKTE